MCVLRCRVEPNPDDDVDGVTSSSTLDVVEINSAKECLSPLVDSTILAARRALVSAVVPCINGAGSETSNGDTLR